MKENENKELEKLADKVMKNTSLEMPSFDFTANVMAQVAEMPKAAVPVYRPLLPKPFWIGLAIAIVVLVGYIYFSGNPQESVSYAVDFKQLYSNSFQSLATVLKFSKTAMYAILALLLAILVQIPIVKSRFAKNMHH